MTAASRRVAGRIIKAAIDNLDTELEIAALIDREIAPLVAALEALLEWNNSIRNVKYVSLSTERHYHTAADQVMAIVMPALAHAKGTE